MRDENRVGLGWLRFSCDVRYLSYWKKRVKQFFKVRPKSRGKGWQGYSESLQAGLGILIAYTPRYTEQERQALGIKPSPNEGMMTVDITQSALDSLRERNHLALWLEVFGCDGVNITRFDIYYDDYCKVVSPRRVYDLCEAGLVGVPKIKKMRPDGNHDLGTGKSMGWTTYFGSEKSDKQFRYYDKCLESDGQQDCYRLELEGKGQYANEFAPYMLEALERAMNCDSVADSVSVLKDAYKALLKGSISFHELPPGTDPRNLPQNWAARTPKTWWWKEMMAGLEPAKLTLDRVEPSLEKSVAWIKSQVAPSLALIRSVFGRWGIPFTSWLHRALDDGEERWKDKHWQMFEDACLTSPAV